MPSYQHLIIVASFDIVCISSHDLTDSLSLAHQHAGKSLPSVLWRELVGNFSLSYFLSSAMPKGKQEKYKEVAMIIPK